MTTTTHHQGWDPSAEQPGQSEWTNSSTRPVADVTDAPPSSVAVASMAATERKCAWCPTTFLIARRPGRPRIYCSHSCRQRAHERRQGLGVLPPPDRIIMTPGGPTGHLPTHRTGYEGGIVRYTPARHHALRPAGRSEPGLRRLTLCGLLAFAVPNPFFGRLADSCKTCAAIERIRPSARAIRPSPDLAALRLMLDIAAVESSRSTRSKHPLATPDEILARLLAAA